MQKLNNNTLQIFLDRFIEELKENESMNLDIPFIISSLYQDFKDDVPKYHSFIKDLNTYPDYNIVIFNSQNNWNGIIDVNIDLVKYEKNDINNYYDQNRPGYNYKLCFSYDERNYRLCECTPDMSDYREDKHCCGHECDANFCEFSLYKVLYITSGTWEGDEHDYWNFEDEFYLGDKELAEKKKNEDRKRQIEELKNRIKADQKTLAELEKM